LLFWFFFEMSTTCTTYFWVADSQVALEVTAALEECLPAELHSRVVCELNKRKSPYWDTNIVELKNKILDSKQQFDKLDLTMTNFSEWSQYQWEWLMALRYKLVEYRKKSFDEARAPLVFMQSRKLSEYYKVVYLFKEMTFNSELFTADSYKQLVLELLRYMKDKGFLFALLLFCELCPEFVQEDCVPKYRLFLDTRDSLGCLSTKAPAHRGVFDDGFYMQLLTKHKDRVHLVVDRNNNQ